MTKFIDCSNEAKEEKKETVFTHVQEKNGWRETSLKPNDYNVVKYLGECNIDGDMFSAYDDVVITIFKGIKGSEFD